MHAPHIVLRACVCCMCLCVSVPLKGKRLNNSNNDTMPIDNNINIHIFGRFVTMQTKHNYIPNALAWLKNVNGRIHTCYWFANFVSCYSLTGKPMNFGFKMGQNIHLRKAHCICIWNTGNWFFLFRTISSISKIACIIWANSISAKCSLEQETGLIVTYARIYRVRTYTQLQWICGNH